MQFVTVRHQRLLWACAFLRRALLLSVPGFSDAVLGGSISNTAISIGFVPCTASTADPVACIFGLKPAVQNDHAFFPYGEVSTSALSTLPFGFHASSEACSLL